MPSLVPDSDSEDELPPAWEERATNDGYVYYVKYDPHWLLSITFLVSSHVFFKVIKQKVHNGHTPGQENQNKLLVTYH